jgi:alanine-synthesizing transaminase
VFSRRLPEELRPNAITRLRRSLGDTVIDLTASNPTACGLPYPPDLLAGLSRPEGLVYRPDARGLPGAREAIARGYLRHGLEIDPGRIVLAASTSEAYSFVFKLLGDPGDEILAPRPSYPLIEHLAALEGLVARSYRLDPDEAWRPRLGEALEGAPRAIVAVHPNNPTGSFLDSGAARDLTAACARSGAALIIDEVFLDYPLDREVTPRSFGATEDVLTFTLGGLSKSVGLPQLKLAWIVLSGPAAAVEAALERLEFLADQYLAVATPVQVALPTLLAAGRRVRQAILERCRANLRALSEIFAPLPAVSVLSPGGGWSAVLRYPRVVAEEELILDLLRRDRVAVHPGYFFDFPDEGYLVLSLLPEPARFADGAGRVMRRIAAAA